MESRLNSIKSYLESFEKVTITEALKQSVGQISGKITIEESGAVLEFEIDIYPQYPFQFHETETIQFINRDLLPYNHVNGDGSICIHTLHNVDLKSKLYFDIESLKQWIKKFYIEEKNDKHYEHIVVTEYSGLKSKSCFLFSEVNHEFKKDDFGTFVFSHLATGNDNKYERETFIVNHFSIGKKIIECAWSSHYRVNKNKEGIFLFIEKPPVQNRRFIVQRWIDLEPFVTQAFLKYLYDLKKNVPFRKRGLEILPLFIGYKIPNDEIHWQCAMIETSNFPNESVDLGSKEGYIGQFKEIPIKWSSTKNCSYKYFFGRGKFSSKLTEKRILIVGIGAIGSIIAVTLTRGGCKFLSLVDYDTKKPENVCRSEYSFDTGITNKVIDLGKRLIDISPFVEIIPETNLMDAIKYFINNKSLEVEIRKKIEDYDLIIDCTADNDVAYILDSLNLNNEVISISITNNARALLCSVKPNLYKWLTEKNDELQKEDEKLYEPLGCWNPTFKASYNDINALVQFALKHLNTILEQGKTLRHFYLSTNTEEGYNINIHQF